MNLSIDISIIMITTGLENLINNIDQYKNRSIALIANQTSVTHNLKYSWDILKQKGIKLKRIFSPEHGLFSTEQDQYSVKNQPVVNSEIISLYGDSFNSLIPDDSCLDDIDLILFDIQDIGSRYYTYVNTMALFMKAIHGRDIEFMILDRPNPLGGHTHEGPLLSKDFESFVGIIHTPIRHGMTAAELALLYKDHHKLDINLSVTKMKGWKREMLYRDTGLPWIPPSPNMPTEYTAYLYPGMCLLEGTNISEGRGTTTPFCNIGAPYINPIEFIVYINTFKLQGITFRPIYFKPTFNKYSGDAIGGIYIHITDVDKFLPFLTGIAIVKAAYDLYGDDFKFLKGFFYEFNDTHPAFDLLTGGSKIRRMILDKKSLDVIKDSWKDEEQGFLQLKNRFGIY